MKKIFVFCLMAFLCAVTVGAQTKMKMKLTLTNGSEPEYFVDSVLSITFIEVASEVKPLSIVEHSVSSITYSKARLNLTVEGYYDESSEVGVIYSFNEEEVMNSETANISGSIRNRNMFFDLANLDPETTYYYKLYVQQHPDSAKIYTEIGEFTTEVKPDVPEFVDLGLSVKWATRNIGADNIGDTGGLYVWGDATGGLSLLNTASSDLSTLFSDLYNIESIAGTKYDIATNQRGKDWRLPTKDELEELSTLSAERVDNYQGTGVGGFLFTGNGNEIFFPSSGYINSSGTHGNYAYTYYWSSDKTSNPSNVYYANINYGGASIMETTYKAVMFAVRPVYVGEVSEDPVDENAPVAVNLGFDIDWADRNVGASSKTELGKFYAWGETDAKDDYQLSTYNWRSENQGYENIGDNNNISGYNAYDVVKKEWGGEWRMPTSDEMERLVTQCKWEWTFRDKVAGFVVTSKDDKYKGKELFFPAGGYMNGKEQVDDTGVYYWTASKLSMRDDMAFDLEKRDNTPQVSHLGRQYGLLIRPVRDR